MVWSTWDQVFKIFREPCSGQCCLIHLYKSVSVWQGCYKESHMSHSPSTLLIAVLVLTIITNWPFKILFLILFILNNSCTLFPWILRLRARFLKWFTDRLVSCVLLVIIGPQLVIYELTTLSTTKPWLKPTPPALIHSGCEWLKCKGCNKGAMVKFWYRKNLNTCLPSAVQ